MIGAAANSYMHGIGSQWQRERNAELEWAAVSWGGALRDDPNNGREGDYGCRESNPDCILSQRYAFGNLRTNRWWLNGIFAIT